jgi:hypothetical protein
MPDPNWSMRLHLQELEKVRRRLAAALIEADLEESMCAPSGPPQRLSAPYPIRRRVPAR